MRSFMSLALSPAASAMVAASTSAAALIQACKVRAHAVASLHNLSTRILLQYKLQYSM